MSLVALVDGLLRPDHPAFAEAVDLTGAAVAESPAGRHALAMASAIGQGAPGARILSLAVFAGTLATRAEILARALSVAAEREVDIVHCSLGLARDDPGVAAAVARLLQKGAVVVAAAAARGGPVWPAALPGVIAVQGDARCGPGEWSRLHLPTADYGADPRLAGDPAIGGASVAAAHLTGIIAASGVLGERDARRMLDDGAAHIGRERRLAAEK